VLNEEKQGISPLDLFTVVFSFAFVLYISAPIITHFLESKGIAKAQIEIAELTAGLRQPGALSKERFAALNLEQNNMLSHGQSRAIASETSSAPSDLHPGLPHGLPPGLPPKNFLAEIREQTQEGTLGKDPWGRSYHYLFVHNHSGMPTHVVVWSDGPDGISQTSVRAQVSQNSFTTSISFQGDDVGTTTALR
jgi:hypothetical protein